MSQIGMAAILIVLHAGTLKSSDGAESTAMMRITSYPKIGNKMSIFLMFVIELGVGQTDRAASSEF
jgi:hypothetical protein